MDQGRRGGVGVPENEPPPMWLSLTSGAVGVGLVAFGASDGNLGVILTGLLFGSLAVALALTTVRASHGRRPPRALDEPAQVEVFTRSPMRILMDLVLAPAGGVAFLVGALLWLGLGPIGLIATTMFAFFGIVMLRGAAVSMRRGLQSAVAEIGPDGIWTPELPRRLAWSEIARLEVEDARGSSGEQGPGTTIYRGLGIWPRDEAIADQAPGRGVTGMIRAFTRFANSVDPDAGLSDPAEMAPFSIQAFEIEQDLGDVLRSVRRYAPIVGFPDGAERPVEVRVVPATPVVDGVLGAILGNLGRVAGAPEPVVDAGRVLPDDRATGGPSDAADHVPDPDGATLDDPRVEAAHPVGPTDR